MEFVKIPIIERIEEGFKQIRDRGEIPQDYRLYLSESEAMLLFKHLYPADIGSSNQGKINSINGEEYAGVKIKVVEGL